MRCFILTFLFILAEIPYSYAQRLLTQAQIDALRARPRLTLKDTIEKDVLDSCLYVVKYEHRFRPFREERMVMRAWEQELQIGKRYHRYADLIELQRDSIWDDAIRRGLEREEFYERWSGVDMRPDSHDALLFHMETDTLECRDNVAFDRYRYYELIAPQAWRLTEGDSVVTGYKCHRAECRWRGRDYVAWYSEDLPLSYGPYKFRGLPGLILCLYDTQDDHHFTLTHFAKVPQQGYIYRKRRKSDFFTTRSVFRRLQRYDAEHPDGYQSYRITRKSAPAKKRRRVFNPIELE